MFVIDLNSLLLSYVTSLALFPFAYLAGIYTVPLIANAADIVSVI